jgi:Zn-dependent protease/CBS domain-containing protein
MAWSIPLLRVAGTEIRMHLTFLILLAWVGIAEYLAGGANAALDAMLFVIAVFACVVLHELGHALAARRYGITTPDITLLPIGGVARLSRIPDNPSEEVVIAIAGPLVNVVIAGVLIALGGRIDFTGTITTGGAIPDFLTRLATVNIFLVLFNLIPAFPMDGGRVLRALLTFAMGRQRATAVAARIGQGLAFVFGFLGLMGGNAILVFVAIFVFIAAGAEAGEASLREIARRIPVDRAMVRVFETLAPSATVDDAADALIRTTQHEFPVVDGAGKLRGFLERDVMIRALKATGPQTPVLDVMRRDVPVVRSSQPLDLAIRLMQENQVGEVGVVDSEGRLIGYVSRENLAEFMMIEDAGARPAASGSPAPAGGRLL